MSNNDAGRSPKNRPKPGPVPHPPKGGPKPGPRPGPRPGSRQSPRSAPSNSQSPRQGGEPASFVNPYTFIEFPTQVKRAEPLWHNPSRDDATTRYTGTLTVTWTPQTPLAIPSDGSWGLKDSDTGEIRIPGSSIKGAVRSLHEALFHGCARIIDPGYTPVYRDAMTPQLQKGWTLGIVFSQDADVAQDQNAAVTILPLRHPVWIDAEAIKEQADGFIPKTGDAIRLDNDPQPGFARTVHHDVNNYVSIERGTPWVEKFIAASKAGLSFILVTDTAARNAKHGCYWAAAQPDTSYRNSLPVSSTVLRQFRRKLAHADQAGSTAGVFENVQWPHKDGPVIAQKRTVDGFLRQGDVVWIKVQDDTISDIKLSLGWRTPASGAFSTVKSRIPQDVLPCQHADQGLCLSCVIFGSAEANETPEESQAHIDDGRQGSYGGHVRFGDAVGACSRGQREVALAPLGTPHPGAGMFYLDYVSPQALAEVKERDDLPSQWDSAVDSRTSKRAGRRGLRGRKFYWHSDPAAQKEAKGLSQPRYEAVKGVHTNDEIQTKVHLVHEGELSQTITFDGLDATALATLLAALDPTILFGEGQYALRLGRGKPLGLGSVKTSVKLAMTTTADRYRPDAATLTELPNLDSVLRNDVPQRCGNLDTTHDQAKKVLAVDGLGNDAVHVSYPTTRPWSDYGQPAFHESFTFFQENSGTLRGNKGWQPLPLIYEESQTLPIPNNESQSQQHDQRKRR